MSTILSFSALLAAHLYTDWAEPLRSPRLSISRRTAWHGALFLASPMLCFHVIYTYYVAYLRLELLNLYRRIQVYETEQPWNWKLSLYHNIFIGTTVFRIRMIKASVVGSDSPCSSRFVFPSRLCVFDLHLAPSPTLSTSAPRASPSSRSPPRSYSGHQEKVCT